MLELEVLTAFCFFLFGIIFGSFANVVALRLPEGKSLLTPSHCRKCGTAVAWRDNVPLLSYLLLRGRCRKCQASYSVRYFMVELIMGLLFAAAYWHLGMQWFLLEFLIFIFMSVTASVIDIDHFILPDVFTIGGLVLALIGGAINPDRSFTDALVGFLFGGGLLYAVAVIYMKLRNKEGMGGGDIKLLAWIGALLGWHSVPFVIFISCVAGTIFTLIRFIRTPKGLSEPIQFGPFLVGAAMLFVFLGAPTMVQTLTRLYGID